MKDQILTHLQQPAQLEKLYRSDKAAFKRAFNSLYPGIKDQVLAAYWHERLNYTAAEIHWGNRNELVFALILALLAGLVAKLPAIFSIDEEFFYPRNIGFIVFPFLTAWFAWKNKLSAGKIGFAVAVSLAGLIYINLLPDVKEGNAAFLACIHLPIVLWAVLGFAFVGDSGNMGERRLGFVKYNGDLAVMIALIAISGGIMSAITIGLFKLIGYDIEEFYFQNVIILGMAAAPMVGTYLIRTNPQLVGKVSPVIAKLFSPLVLIMLVVYLAAIAFSGKDPYNDREFLMVFNVLLIGVMAIIFFSVAGTPAAAKSRAENWILFLLSAVTIVVNGIALSAILFRISEWGFTPNRTAVLGSNILILVHLLLVTATLFRALTGKTELNGVGKIIAVYLPVYAVWAAIVVFLFPAIF